MLVMCWGCLTTRKETQTQTIKVNPTPPAAGAADLAARTGRHPAD